MKTIKQLEIRNSAFDGRAPRQPLLPLWAGELPGGLGAVAVYADYRPVWYLSLASLLDKHELTEADLESPEPIAWSQDDHDGLESGEIVDGPPSWAEMERAFNG